mgnify:CR=1 FL=1
MGPLAGVPFSVKDVIAAAEKLGEIAFELLEDAAADVRERLRKASDEAYGERVSKNSATRP